MGRASCSGRTGTRPQSDRNGSTAIGLTSKGVSSDATFCPIRPNPKPNVATRDHFQREPREHFTIEWFQARDEAPDVPSEQTDQLVLGQFSLEGIIHQFAAEIGQAETGRGLRRMRGR